MKYLFSVLVVMAICHSTYGQEDVQALFTKGVEAYEAKDYKRYLTRMLRVDELMPNHPVVTTRLARAYALTGRKARGVQYLRKAIMLDATINFEDDVDLQSLKGYKGYLGVVNLKNLLLSEEQNDELYRVIDADSLHPESFVILDNGEILLGSVRQKKIVKVDSGGRVWDWLEMPYSVFGMKIDSETGYLWAATAATPEMLGYEEEDKGNSVIVQIEIETGRVIQGMSFDEEELYGDLILDSESRIWLSNSMIPYLSRDDTDTTFYIGAFVRKQFDLGSTHFNLQGLTLNDDESVLYFADYRAGIYRMDLAEDDIEKVQANSDFLPVGVDGLYYYNNSLIAIHNGVKPFKVIQYLLDDEGENIVGQRTINRGGPSLGEPTLGQIKDGYFYYIANSPWGAYDEDKKLLIEKIAPLEIRRIKLQ